jgi:hypothetical protein
MRPAILSLLFCAIGLWPADAFAGKPPWRVNLKRAGFEEVARERGVTVYQDENAEILTVGAEGRIPAPARKVQQALLDYPRQVGVIERLREARVLERGLNWQLVYQRLELPLISDRDFTLYVTHGEHRGSYWVNYWSKPDAGPKEQRGAVRVTRHRGAWELVPIEGGRATRLRHEMSIDLGGALPPWLADSGAGDELPKVFGSICRLSVPKNEQSKCP